MYSWPQRKNLRLKSFDYNQAGYYFVTICCKNREHFFWEIREGKMQYSQMWEIARQEIESDIREDMMIDTYVIMPNHIHTIVVIQETDIAKNHVGCDGIAPWTDNVPRTQNISHTVGCDGIAPWTHTESGTKIAPTTDIVPWTNTGTMQSFPTLSRMIRWFKWRVTSQILQHCESGYLFAWQKSFYDVIIRNEEQLHKTRQYILDNPKNWESDVNYV